MPSIRIINLEPGDGPIGTGFCVLMNTGAGTGAPSAEAVAAGGARHPMTVVAVDGQRGLWSAYLDDGIDLRGGKVTVKSDGCVGGALAPNRT